MKEHSSCENETFAVNGDYRKYGIEKVDSRAEPLLPYIIAVLKEKPVPPPLCSRDQWFSLFTLVGKHSIPLLYYKIKSLPFDFHPPSEVLDWMRVQFLASKVRSLCVCRQLEEMAAVFDSEDVKVLVLKGAAFGLTIYPDPALRYSDDIDILVRPRDFTRAWKLLERLGYYSRDEFFDHSRKSHIETWFAHPDRNKKYLPLELHRDIHSCLPFGSEMQLGGIFDRAISVAGTEFSFNVLHPVDALIYASLHLTVHHPDMFRLIWIYDMALLARALNLASHWRCLQRRSVKMNARLAVERCMKLARAWTGLRLPEGFDDFASWPKAGALEEDMAYHVPRWKKSTVSTFKYYWPADSDFGGKVWHLMRILFPSLRFMRAAHAPPRDWLLPLSYVNRWVRWLHRFKE